MTRIVFLAFLFLISAGAARACPVCERNQPDVLKGIVHGAGPGSNWDYVIVWLTAGVVLVTLFYSVRWLVNPGERSGDHIKRTILNEL